VESQATLRLILWNQFGAAIDTLAGALRTCPDTLWERPVWRDDSMPRGSEYWYIIFHTLFWTDHDLAESADAFKPPPPFGLEELDPAGNVPAPAYSKDQLQTYLEYCREQARTRIETVSDLFAPQHVRSKWTDMSIAELVLYNTRHVQEHAAQLNLFLGQNDIAAPNWVSRARR